MKILSLLLTLLIVCLFFTFKATLCRQDTEDFKNRRRAQRRHRSWHRNFPRYANYWNPSPTYVYPTTYGSYWWPQSTWWSPPGKRYCQDCGDYSRGGCASCSNCGFAINESGSGQCIPGDQKGPYFQQDAISWEY